MSGVATGPEDLEHLEDRVLFHAVDLAGATSPLRFGEYLPASLVAERLHDDPALNPDLTVPDDIIYSALRGLEDTGLIELMEVMGPARARPTRRGRDRVLAWQKTWEQNRDAAVQEAILVHLDAQRSAHTGSHALVARINTEQLVRDLGIDHAAYLASAERLLEQGRIALSQRDSPSLGAGDAYITERGVGILRGESGSIRPGTEVERAWNEVARLRKELEMVKQSPADLIADPELLRRCADLLNADLDFDRVIREASVVLEDRIRRLTGSDTRSAVPLMTSVFSANRPMLRISADSQEQTGAMNIYAGVMGLFRNQGGHRLSATVTQRDALRFVVMVDLLLSLAEKAAAQIAASSTIETQPAALSQ